MKLLTELLSAMLQPSFISCGYDGSLGQVVISDRLDLCQFQCNGALSGAKLYKKSPMAIANEVVNSLKNGEIPGEIHVAPPGFINITLDDCYLTQYIEEVFADPNKGIPQTEIPETIVLDYGNPNIAKPLHVGHLRSAIIGESLKRIIAATGRKVIGDVHLGDWGMPMGLVIAQLTETYGDAIPPLSTDLLNEIYPLASQKSKIDETFLNKARDITAKLQNGDAGYTAIWQDMVAVSVDDMKKTYSRLGATFDYWYGESSSDHYIPELLHILKNKGLLHESQGAQVVDVIQDHDKAPMPPVIIKKSNNSSIYATTDLATIMQRNKEFSPSRIWYLVDYRQNLHFEQIFRCARKAGLISPDTELTHISFGTVNGKDGKPFKTRDGNVMELSELLDTVVNAAAERTKTSNITDEEARKQTAEKIGMAAVKFGDLINHHTKDCIFDIEKHMSSDGKTGVYLLYTVARIQSILKKAHEFDFTQIHLTGIYSQSERELIFKLSQCGDSFLNAFDHHAPNIICENAYQIAAAFSGFYCDNQILNEKDTSKRSSWISLCVITKEILIKHLDALGIETVEMM